MYLKQYLKITLDINRNQKLRYVKNELNDVKILDIIKYIKLKTTIRDYTPKSDEKTEKFIPPDIQSNEKPKYKLIYSFNAYSNIFKIFKAFIKQSVQTFNYLKISKHECEFSFVEEDSLPLHKLLEFISEFSDLMKMEPVTISKHVYTLLLETLMINEYKLVKMPTVNKTVLRDIIQLYIESFKKSVPVINNVLDKLKNIEESEDKTYDGQYQCNIIKDTDNNEIIKLNQNDVFNSNEHEKDVIINKTMFSKLSNTDSDDSDDTDTETNTEINTSQTNDEHNYSTCIQSTNHNHNHFNVNTIDIIDNIIDPIDEDIIAAINNNSNRNCNHISSSSSSTNSTNSINSSSEDEITDSSSS